MTVRPDTLPLSPPAAAEIGDRLPGFERVRAGAMALVVAFHAALPYACGALPGLLWVVPVTGERAGVVADPIFWIAEAVIMPLFFGMSGFWSARLGQRGDAARFVSGRVRRIALPLAVGCGTVLVASLLIWTLSLPLTGRATWSEALRFDPPGPIRDLLWGTSHLWYLEYLFLLALLQVPLDAVAASADRGESPRVARALATLDGWMRSSWRWALPTAGVAVVLAAEPEVYLGFQHRWFPHTEKFLHSGVCFLFGWLCWRNRAALSQAGRSVTPLTIAAVLSALPLVLVAREAVAGAASDRALALPAGLCAGLTLTAALVHGASSARPAGRWTTFLAAASFWVYLVHQPLVGALQLSLWFADWPADAEFALVFVAALTLCLATEPLSRRTRVGRLLTGRAGRKETPARVDRPLRKAA